MDETDVKVKGIWIYYYHAVDNHGNVVDLYPSEHSDESSTKVLLKEAIGLPNKIVIDKA